jgi:hypothetical protein
MAHKTHMSKRHRKMRKSKMTKKNNRKMNKKMHSKIHKKTHRSKKMTKRSMKMQMGGELYEVNPAVQIGLLPEIRKISNCPPGVPINDPEYGIKMYEKYQTGGMNRDGLRLDIVADQQDLKVETPQTLARGSANSNKVAKGYAFNTV